MGYTKKEADIINGIIPIDTVSKISILRGIYNKAVQANETDTALKVLPRIEYLEKVIASGYTEMQYKAITGEIKDVTGQLAYQLLQAAKEKNDTEVIALANSYVLLSKERKHAKELIYKRNRNRNLRHGEVIEWREPRSNKYTERQKKVVRGEIPLEQVHTNMLIRICQKAKNNGDIEIYEHIFSLIIDRRTTEKDNYKESIKRLRLISKRGGTTLSHFTQWEKRVLAGDTEDTTIEELEHILAVCEHLGRKNDAVFFSTLLRYRKHPKELYRAKDANEAIDNIERMMRKPIIRPQALFT